MLAERHHPTIHPGGGLQLVPMAPAKFPAPEGGLKAGGGKRTAMRNP
jgi:hypothetical protein